MSLAPGYHGFGTGPAGKTHKNTMGPRPTPNAVGRCSGVSTPSLFTRRGGVSRGSLGKRGR
jgi:hypothetical protein